MRALREQFTPEELHYWPLDCEGMDWDAYLELCRHGINTHLLAPKQRQTTSAA